MTTTAPSPGSEPRPSPGSDTGSEVPPAPDAEPAADAEEQAETPNREAAKYRRQLRETETRATALAERLEVVQRREVERLAATDLAAPADLWLTGPDLPDLLDEAGDVDPAKVATAVTAVLAGRPGWARPDGPPTYDGGARRSAPREVSMQEVLQGRPRRQ